MGSYPDKPLVSIVTVVFNGERTIERTIQSVIDQTYKNIEYIIIDGGSTDGTLGVIDKFKTHISTLISEKDRGIADAMNKGIKLATGELIGLINADDWFEKSAVERVVQASIIHPEAIIHGDMNVYLNNSLYYLAKAPHTLNLNKGMELNHPTVFVPNQLYKKYGYFDTGYYIVFDWELMLKFNLAGIGFYKVNEIISNFSIGGISTVKSKQLIEEMHQVRKKYKVYRFIDKYYLINRIRTIFFGSNVMRVSQKIRFIKHKLDFFN